MRITIHAASITAVLLGAAAAFPANDTCAQHATLLRGTIDLSIGDDRPDYMFRQIDAAAWDALGRIVALEAASQQLRVFSREGKLIEQVGRQGGGPGEFKNPTVLTRDRTGTLWVTDAGQGRFTSFTSTPEGLRVGITVPFSGNGPCCARPLYVDEKGHIVDVGSSTAPSAGTHHSAWIYRDRIGRIIREVPFVDASPTDLQLVQVPIEATIDGSTFKAIRYFQMPFGPEFRVVRAPTGEWASAMTSRYRISWYSEDGTLLRVIERQVEGPKVNAPDRERARAMIDRQLDKFSKAPISRGVPRPQIPTPERKQPIADVFFDSAGRLWVELSVNTGDTHRAEVYDRDGHLTEIAEWPADVALFPGAIEPKRALGLIEPTGDEGGPRLVRLSFRRVDAK